MDMVVETIATADSFKMGFDEDYASVQSSDVLLRTIGYQYCKICFLSL